jgi:hypothetical protein
MPTVGQREVPKPEKNLAPDALELRDGPRRKIVIDKQENYEGDQQVNLCVNERTITVQRGVPVEITEPYIENLNNAVYTYMKKDEKTGEDKEYQVPRYSWRFVQ